MHCHRGDAVLGDRNVDELGDVLVFSHVAMDGREEEVEGRCVLL